MGNPLGILQGVLRDMGVLGPDGITEPDRDTDWRAFAMKVTGRIEAKGVWVISTGSIAWDPDRRLLVFDGWGLVWPAASPPAP